MKRTSVWAFVAVVSAAALAACLKLDGYNGPGSSSGSPYTDEDAGTGYEIDLAGEDLAGPTPQMGQYHPAGYKAITAHGRDLKWQVQDCRTCHGADLTGGVAGAGGPGTMAPPSCDSCHQAGWRTNCTYCHGTAGNASGNPPRDLDEQTDPTKISFPAHIAHVSGRITPSLDCINCHRKPTDVLSPYHVFDASPRRAENNLTGGLSSVGVYDPVLGKCTNLYCHGTGRGSSGTVTKLMPGPLGCDACHGSFANQASWTTMSARHTRHLPDADCTYCHSKTTGGTPDTIGDKTLHINGKPDVTLSTAAAGVTYDAAAKKCTGTCHNKSHAGLTW